MDMPFAATNRFAIGQPVSRKEDPVLLRGEGRYSDDLSLPGQLYGVMVRSRYAHGVLRGLDTAEARALPGVLGVFTAADLTAAGIGPMQAPANKHRDGSPTPRPHQTVLASDKVRYVGDPVALVVASSRDAARDAAELVVNPSRRGRVGRRTIPTGAAPPSGRRSAARSCSSPGRSTPYARIRDQRPHARAAPEAQ